MISMISMITTITPHICFWCGNEHRRKCSAYVARMNIRELVFLLSITGSAMGYRAFPSRCSKVQLMTDQTSEVNNKKV